MPDGELQTKPVSQLTQDDEEYENEVVEDDDDEDVDDDENGEAATCSALCSMGASDLNTAASATGTAVKKDCSQWEEFSTSNSCCPKQLQLPMFLSSTYPVELTASTCFEPTIPY